MTIPTLLIGLDIGWSERRRTCGLAIRDAHLHLPDSVIFGNISTLALNRHHVAKTLAPIVRTALSKGRRVLVVADAIVGKLREPIEDRHVDAGCSKEGFYGRAQSYPATHQTGRLLSTTLHDVLNEVCKEVGNGSWTPWIGAEPLPLDGVVVVETNPTTSMALALSMTDPASLPTRASPRLLPDGITRVRAKSDWYWRSGAGALAAKNLGVDDIRNETHHERIAGLWCLHLARSLETNTAALTGNFNGAYLVGQVDPSWEKDIERVGVCWGEVNYANCPFNPPQSTPITVQDLTPRNAVPNDQLDEDAFRGDDISVQFTDSGGLTLRANSWLGTVEQFPCNVLLHGGNGATLLITVTPFDGRNGIHQFRVTPTVPAIMAQFGGPQVIPVQGGFIIDGTLQ